MQKITNSKKADMPEEREHAFLITSVIYPSHNPLSYSAVRSVFSPAERATQTLKTIESIREFYKGAEIHLIEMGLNEKLPNELLDAVDRFIFVGNKRAVRWACDGKHKGLGEAMGLLAARKSITASRQYFKISGRYFLTRRFDPAQWESNEIIVRKYGKDISTRLYSFPQDLFQEWQCTLFKSIPWLVSGSQIEHVLPKFLPAKRVKTLVQLGVAGAVAPDGSLLEE